jgi:hypothetical protein
MLLPNNMRDDNLIRKLIGVTQKMPLEKMLKERQKAMRECPYYKNKLNEINPTQAIFRIETFSCFLDNLMTKQLYFAWPGKWNDIFDGAFVRTPVYFKQGDILAEAQSYNRDYFCQCWARKELEVMWKLYSLPPYETVMSISTVDKVMRQIWKDESCGRYVGLAEYRPIEDMRNENFFQSQFNSSPHLFNEVGIAQTFLFKPSSLSYENEVRFIVRETVEKGEQRERLHLMVNFDKSCSYVDKILIDPRASETFEQYVRDALKKHNLDQKVERSIKSKKLVDETDISEFSQSSGDNYGLPKRYIFNEMTSAFPSLKGALCRQGYFL